MEKSFRRLSNKAVRRAYVQAELVNGVAHQIRVLRQQRKWTQAQLAKKLKTTQTAVCRLEDPSYGKFSVKTLLDVGHAFDVALNVRYMAFSDFMSQTWDTSPHRFQVPSYDEEAEYVGFYLDQPGAKYLGGIQSTLPSSGQVVATVRAKDLYAKASTLGPTTTNVSATAAQYLADPSKAASNG